MSFRASMIAAAFLLATPAPWDCRAQPLMFPSLSNVPSPDRARAVLASLPQTQSSLIDQASDKVFPIFVFLPGVMGSKLVKTAENGNEKVIWGRYEGLFAAPDDDLAYVAEDAHRIRPEVLKQYVYGSMTYDVYGRAITVMRTMDLRYGDSVREFAYDWRQSNKQSADDLSKWLCDGRTSFGNRPMVFVAHSMGGLVLKYWLKAKYETEGCGEEKFKDWIRVQRVIFLGTPHYGAPKALSAFADEYSVLVDPEWPLAGWARRIDLNTFSKGLNLYGPTFPSAYELLPINPATGCGGKSTDSSIQTSVTNSQLKQPSRRRRPKPADLPAPPPAIPTAKELVSLRVDRDVLE